MSVKVKPRQKSSNNVIGMIKTFHDFCESTSLDGYAYLHLSNSLAWKIIWTIVILAMTILAIGFLATNTDQYMKSGLITTIESSTAPLNVSFSGQFRL